MLCFQALQERLVTIARDRVRSGAFTERGLARLCGLSQPHMHNVLKGIRVPSTTSADRLMQVLGIGVPDLIWSSNSGGDVAVEAVPLVKSRIGPGSRASLRVLQGCVPLHESLLEGLVDPVAARLGPDLVLPKPLSAHDLVLLDQNPNARMYPDPASIWVIDEPCGLRLRYVRREADRLFVIDQATLDNPEKWHALRVTPATILQKIAARVVWMSRAMSGAQ